MTPIKDETLKSIVDVIHEFDPNIIIDHNATFVTLNNWDVCPETLMSSEKGANSYKKFQVLDCKNSTPIEDLVTFVVNVGDSTPDSVGNVSTYINGFRQLYPTVQLILAIDTRLNNSWSNVKTHPYNGSPEGTMRKLIKQVQTPYILVGRNLLRWDEQSDLLRLLRVLSKYPSIGAAGGAVRNSTGYWFQSSLLSTMRAYGYKLEDAYEHSLEECMVAHYTSSSFLIRTAILQKAQLKHQGDVMYLSLFEELKARFVKTVVCPDVMFHQDFNTTTDFSKNELLTFAQQWNLDTIILPQALGDETIQFTYKCSDVGISCNTLKVTRYHMLAKCCIREFAAAYEFLDNFARRHNLT